MKRAAALMFVLLAGCGAAPHDDSLFPLAAGHRWAYELTTEWENNVVEHEPRGKAAVEVVALWRWLRKALEDGR